MIDFNSSSSLSGQVTALIDAGQQQARARQSERQYLGASRLGVACERALQFEYAKAPIDHGRELGGLVVCDHRIRPAGDDGFDHPQGFCLRVVAQRLGKADRTRRFTKRFEALPHGGQFDIRRIDHGDLRLVDATFLGPMPVAVHRVKRVLAALRAEHPVDRVGPGVAHTVTLVGVHKAPGLS